MQQQIVLQDKKIQSAEKQANFDKVNFLIA
jgi:hypothetical protein